MKKWLFILFCFVSTMGFAQTYKNSGAYGVELTRGDALESFKIPLRDTFAFQSIRDSIGQIVCRPQDMKMYLYVGSWRQVGSGVGIYLDSAYYHPSNATFVFHKTDGSTITVPTGLVDSLQSRMKYSDTASLSRRIDSVFPFSDKILNGNRVLTGKNRTYGLTLDSMLQVQIKTSASGYGINVQSGGASFMNGSGVGLQLNPGGTLLNNGVSGNYSGVGLYSGNNVLQGSTSVQANTPLFTASNDVQFNKFLNNVSEDSVLTTSPDGHLKQVHKNTIVGDYIPLTQRGAANGVATLDGSAKVPMSQIPDALIGAVVYQGNYNASTNSPALPAASGNKGNYWVVSAAGTQFGLTLSAGDWIISNGSVYQKVDNNNAVTSVAGRTGAVVIDTGDISGFSNKVRTRFTAGAGLSYNPTTGVYSNTGVLSVKGVGPIAVKNDSISFGRRTATDPDILTSLFQNPGDGAFIVDTQQPRTFFWQTTGPYQGDIHFAAQSSFVIDSAAGIFQSAGKFSGIGKFGSFSAKNDAFVSTKMTRAAIDIAAGTFIANNEITLEQNNGFLRILNPNNSGEFSQLKTGIAGSNIVNTIGGYEFSHGNNSVTKIPLSIKFGSTSATVDTSLLNSVVITPESFNVKRPGSVSYNFHSPFFQAEYDDGNGNASGFNIQPDATADGTTNQAVGIYFKADGGWDTKPALTVTNIGNTVPAAGRLETDEIHARHVLESVTDVQLGGKIVFINGVTYSNGNGSPEGVVTAAVGSIYTRKDGGVGTTLYIKETGSGSTGWSAK